MKTLLVINPEKAGKNEINKYPVREAVRAVVTDSSGMVGLVYSKRNNHYKIPGGGIEKGESQFDALIRECKEEIGCDIDITGEIGKIIEYRKMWKLTQVSYGYIARVTGIKRKPEYTQDEIEDGFEPAWLPFKKALKAISVNRAASFEGKNYIVPRDSFFLKVSST